MVKGNSLLCMVHLVKAAPVLQEHIKSKRRIHQLLQCMCAEHVPSPGITGHLLLKWMMCMCLCQVVEKDAIFQRLVEDRFFDAVPCVIVTAKSVICIQLPAIWHPAGRVSL